MNPEKKWARYTKVGDIWINMAKYKQNLQPQSNGCITWRGGRHRQGYGMMSVIRESDMKRVMTTVHRVAMRIKLSRALLPGEDVQQTCGNESCCNPAHLQFKKPKNLSIEMNCNEHTDFKATAY